jgi:hypothetical protein
MKRVFFALAVLAVSLSLLISFVSMASSGLFSNPRDLARLDRRYPAPCIFPPIDSPLAVPCRPPGLQVQAVPCAFDTACPSVKLPCHGVSYGNNPYPLFR